VEKLRSLMIPPPGLPWRTCRDVFLRLEEPGKGSLSNHVCQPGARTYPGHTGSPLDEPAKALKAGDHGVPGGENMMVGAHGSVRYFTVREAARLQGMPDDFEFPRSWTESMRQLGNAVPVTLAETIGRAVRDLLNSKPSRRREAA
jgi:DNA (cytosine-5)-methyltransferase 1